MAKGFGSLREGHLDYILLLIPEAKAYAALKWLKQRTWHYSIRVPSDTLIWGVHRWCACPVSGLRTVRGEAKMYHQVRLWESEIEIVNLALANLRKGRRTLGGDYG